MEVVRELYFLRVIIHINVDNVYNQVIKQHGDMISDTEGYDINQPLPRRDYCYVQFQKLGLS